MCGRYYFDIDIKELKEIAEEAEKNLYEEYKTGEIYPSDTVPIYISENNIKKPMLAEWGLPKPDKKGLIINARAETINGKPMFKKLNRTNRCVIPASAFFEWNKSNGSKNKFAFKKSASVLYMAGLYNEITDDIKNEQLSMFDTGFRTKHIYFTIVTKIANSCVLPIHDRMPLILDNDELIMWLSGENVEKIISNNNVQLSCKPI